MVNSVKEVSRPGDRRLRRLEDRNFELSSEITINLLDGVLLGDKNRFRQCGIREHNPRAAVATSFRKLVDCPDCLFESRRGKGKRSWSGSVVYSLSQFG